MPSTKPIFWIPGQPKKNQVKPGIQSVISSQSASVQSDWLNPMNLKHWATCDFPNLMTLYFHIAGVGDPLGFFVLLSEWLHVVLATIADHRAQTIGRLRRICRFHGVGGPIVWWAGYLPWWSGQIWSEVQFGLVLIARSDRANGTGELQWADYEHSPPAWFQWLLYSSPWSVWMYTLTREYFLRIKR